MSNANPDSGDRPVLVLDLYGTLVDPAAIAVPALRALAERGHELALDQLPATLADAR